MTDITERCDRCGAAAKAHWQLKSGELFLCGHHSHEYAPSLVAQEAFIVTEKESRSDAVHTG